MVQSNLKHTHSRNFANEILKPHNKKSSKHDPMNFSTVSVWQIPLDIQLQIQKCHVMLSKTIMIVDRKPHFLLQCRLNVARAISISNVSIDVWFSSSSSQSTTTCQIPNCACQSSCSFGVQALACQISKAWQKLCQEYTRHSPTSLRNLFLSLPCL